MSEEHMKENIPRFVYHGTDAGHHNDIFTQGLRPPSATERSNWNESDMQAHPEHVYLSTHYAPYYAVNAMDNTDRFNIFEIDLKQCDFSTFYPDEDFVEEAIRLDEFDMEVPGNISLPTGLDKYPERIRSVRDAIDQFDIGWEESVQTTGTFAVRGGVPPQAIRRVASVSPSEAFRAVVKNAETGARNFETFGKKHKLITEWVMGEWVYDPFESFFDEYIEAAHPIVNVTPAMYERDKQIFTESDRYWNPGPIYRERASRTASSKQSSDLPGVN